jgi:hypothetical protein
MTFVPCGSSLKMHSNTFSVTTIVSLHRIPKPRSFKRDWSLSGIRNASLLESPSAPMIWEMTSLPPPPAPSELQPDQRPIKP